LHINDGTIAGMRMKNKNCFSVQYHPEASPVSHDASYLFDEFIERIQEAQNKAKICSYCSFFNLTTNLDGVFNSVQVALFSTN